MHTAIGTYGSGTRVVVSTSKPPDASHCTDHTVLFYDDERFLLNNLAEYVGSALCADERAVVVATPEHRAETEARLRQAGMDLSTAAAERRYVALDARETLDRI